MLELKLLLLLLIANGAPVIARHLFELRFNFPLDGGLNFFDGQPLLGESKTLRGVVLSVIATTIVAILLHMH